ncbi:MAG: lipid carrier--UDP-N-acetylgalactosaminyltransferase [Flavobacteriaceae bacterium]|nr:lipid carrier--UDP-N-acetylgalactosaminyltransferase [Flavobacteriaceae bacterium]|tara:strand:- start:3281 stop:3934 length:654 start_codon:yes stop_codon:yes gene_type:complete
MYRIIKRLIDLIVSVLIILLLLPFFVLVVILLKLTGEGEIFYFQDRVGYKNKVFKIWKFATMLKNSPNMGSGDVTLRNDPRVTTVGKFLRITKINEFPQLINILKGDMTIVGPRPLMKVGFDRYEKKYKESIYNVKPGLTGIGSIAFRDEEKIMTESNMPPHECYEKIILPMKGSLELWYQEHASLSVDFKIMFLTFWNIVFPNSKMYKKCLKDLPL